MAHRMCETSYDKSIHARIFLPVIIINTFWRRLSGPSPKGPPGRDTVPAKLTFEKCLHHRPFFGSLLLGAGYCGALVRGDAGEARSASAVASWRLGPRGTCQVTVEPLDYMLCVPTATQQRRTKSVPGARVA